MRTHIVRRATWAAVFLGSVAGAPVAAQTTAADAASEQAATLYSRPTQFVDAAELHLRAATLRESGDPRRVKDLELAGRLFIYAGQIDRGVDALTEGARTAVINGDLARAGSLYLDAAFVSAGANQTARARSYVQAARWVADAPLLTDAEKAKLRRRMADLEVDTLLVGA